MSDQNIGKKMCEEHDLEHFIDAYKYVTGEELIIVSGGERPDFICEKNGQQIGIELNKVIRDPRDAFWDKTIEKQEFMDSSHALDFIYAHIASKTKKRNKDNWIETILVLQLMDFPLSGIKTILANNLQDDFATTGFAGIWLADYTGLDAYGDIELFGLFPLKWWGFHPRKNQNQKPYG